MNQVQFKESWKQFKGPLKEQWAKLTDEDLLQIDGNQDEVIQWVNRRYAKWSGWYEGYEEAKTATHV
jgi:uncharacterized protein YjbJ (UPF0337 family)